jgi:hypothetical protein
MGRKTGLRNLGVLRLCLFLVSRENTDISLR